MAIAAALVAAIASGRAVGGTSSTTLEASVTSNGHLALAEVTGNLVTRLRAGTYVVRVHDLNRKQNFHLYSRSAGVNRRTGVRYVGTSVWTLKLRKGNYVYFSDSRPSKKVAFRVV